MKFYVVWGSDAGSEYLEDVFSWFSLLSCENFFPEKVVHMEWSDGICFLQKDVCASCIWSRFCSHKRLFFHLLDLSLRKSLELPFAWWIWCSSFNFHCCHSLSTYLHYGTIMHIKRLHNAYKKAFWWVKAVCLTLKMYIDSR